MYEENNACEAVAKIVVIGVGGAGNNAVNRMIDDNIDGIDFYVANTDKQALDLSKTSNKILLGRNLTNGLGAGGDPSVGKAATEETIEEIKEIIKGKDMVFIAAGMGGGTGTGGAPVIAKAAKEMGILTIAIVTRPFCFEGTEKIEYAVKGLQELSEHVDSIIVVSNDKLLVHSGKLGMLDSFKEADDVLALSVKTVTDMILTPYLINLDFADVKKILKDSGIALIGSGSGEGVNKAEDAVAEALNSPLVETGVIGARKALLAVTGGNSSSLLDVNKAVNKLNQLAGHKCNIKVAVNKNPALEDRLLVSIIATDFENSDDLLNKPVSIFGDDSFFENTDTGENINEAANEETSEESQPSEDTNVTPSEENFEDSILPDFLESK